MRYLAVDDENLQLNKLVETINEASPNNEILAFNNPIEALEEVKDKLIHVAFLDVEMAGMSGVELAKRLKEINPEINIIFVTGYTEYALEAYGIHASGYLTKPVTVEKIQYELANLRYPMPPSKKDKDIVIQCFGNFEIYYHGEPLKFARSKTKELIAYLVDRQGAVVAVSELSKLLFNEDKPSYVRNLVADLSKVLKAIGQEKIIVKHFNAMGINKDEITCDFYDYLENEPYAVKKYHGEYISQYSWAKSHKNKLFKK